MDDQAAPLSALPKKVWGFLAGLLDQLDVNPLLDPHGAITRAVILFTISMIAIVLFLSPL